MTIETLDHNEKIGGRNVIVEIDESLFENGKEGIWVMGGVERTSEKKCFFKVVKNRNAQTIRSVIRKYVKPRSKIFTDMWRGYKNLGELNMRHISINHGKNFVDPGTGAHTNTIEGLWAVVKSKIRSRYRTKKLINNHFQEFIWRRKHKSDLWKGLLDSLREISYE